MYIVVVLLTLFWLPQQQASCEDVASCRTMAEAAREAKDYEAFHDLAWAAYRAGKNNDTGLMLLVARAQSLSGRPGDALVMLERIAALGVATDAATSEDFARVRALPRWTEVAERFASAGETASVPTSAKAPEARPAAKDPAPSSAKAPEGKPSAKDPAPSSAKAPEGRPSAKDPAPSSAKAPEGKPSATDPAPSSAKASEGKPSAKDPAPSSAKAPEGKPSAKDPLSFTTVMTPGALAYDAVSRRFIIADRKVRRVAVVDENTGQVATMVGALDAPGEIAAIAIDSQQGDLWIVSTNGETSALHKLQLISGRVLATVPLEIEHPVTAMTHAPGQGLIVADANGAIWRVRADGRSDQLAALEYVPLALAADTRGRLYVAGGTSRLARFSFARTLRRIDTVDLDRAIPAEAPFVASGNRLHFVVPVQGSFEIRSVPVK